MIAPSGSGFGVRSGVFQVPQCLNKRRKILGPWGFEPHRLVRGGMLEPEHIGMQRLAREFPCRHVSFCLGIGPWSWCLPRAAIGGIADKRVAEMGEVHPDLVCS